MSDKRQRPDSYEASLSEEELEQLHALLLDRSLSLDDVKKVAPPHRGGRYDGQLPSTKTLGVIATRLRTDDMLLKIEASAKMMQAVRSKATKACPGQNEEVLDAICDLVGQEVIEKTVAGVDPKNRTAAARILLKRADQKRFDQKFKQQLKTDLEKGLDALYETIKGIPEAVAAFQQLQGIVSKATQ